jgi:gluconate:H+ symporter, GntP family
VSEVVVVSSLQLLAAALFGVALIVLLIARLRLHPFLALTLGSLAVALLSERALDAALQSYGKGFGDTMAGVGVLVALGAVFGRLFADTGAADAIVTTLLARTSARSLPWMMAAIGALIGLPLFFEVGLVLLMPVIQRVAVRSGVPRLQLAIPALAGLSAMHGLVPPHPGPLVAVQALGAEMGLTLALGALIAVPATLLAGPTFATLAPWARVNSAEVTLVDREPEHVLARTPFALALATILLPVVLMMGKALAELAPESGGLGKLLGFVGRPLLALLLSVAFAMLALGPRAGLDRRALAKSVDASLPPIASILLIVAAGGGFKQTLIDARVGDVASTYVRESELSPLVLAWLLAVSIRLATGSATVATITASGLLAPVAAGFSSSGRSLLALAIGAGSLFFSHVNDAGFWLVKEYFGLSVSQTIKTWSTMETLLSLLGLCFVLLLDVWL